MINNTVIRNLKNIIGHENVLTHSSELIAYSYDGQLVSAMPDAMVLATQTQDVASVVKLASEHHIPVVARGAGSGMTGGSVPEHVGIVLNLERMNRIIRIDDEDRIGYVQPGVITDEFQKEAAKRGLFYPPKPASSEFSSIGGNVAESAGGLGCVKYGLTKQFVEGLDFVTAGRAGAGGRRLGKTEKTGCSVGCQKMRQIPGTVAVMTGVTGDSLGLHVPGVPLSDIG